MKTAIIIAAVVLLLLVFVFRTLQKVGKAMQIADPLATIQKDGFLGFVIGDSLKMVWSRIEHLNLMTQEQKDKFKKDLDMYKLWPSMGLQIGAAYNKFDEIDCISFSFDERANLNSILVFVKSKPNLTKKAHIKEIRDKYVGVLGNPSVESDMSYQWHFTRNSIFVTYEKEQVLVHIIG